MAAQTKPYSVKPSVTGFRSMVSSLKAETARVTKGTSVDLARQLVRIRTICDETQEIQAELKKLQDELAYNLVPDSFEREGLKSYTLDEGYRVTVQGYVRASAKNKEEAIKWLEKNGFEGVPQTTINASTLSGVARSLLEEGKELPEEIFTTNTGSQASVTKVK